MLHFARLTVLRPEHTFGIARLRARPSCGLGKRFRSFIHTKKTKIHTGVAIGDNELLRSPQNK